MIHPERRRENLKKIEEMDEKRAMHFINSLRDKSKRPPVTISPPAALEIADLLQEAIRLKHENRDLKADQTGFLEAIANGRMADFL